MCCVQQSECPQALAYRTTDNDAKGERSMELASRFPLSLLTEVCVIVVVVVVNFLSSSLKPGTKYF